MAFKERINPKNGKKEYKYRYYFIRDGKKRDSETAWFNTKEKAKREGERLKAAKEKADRSKVLQRRDKKLITAYEEFIDHLKTLSDKEISNTNKKEWQTAKAIYNNHFPIKIQNTRIADIDSITFRKWLSEINSKDTVGGGYVRLCRADLVKFNSWLSQNGYYVDEPMDKEEEIEIRLKRTKIKSSKVNNRELSGERNIVSILDIEKICKHFFDRGLGDFENFYYYTLFYVLFYGGMRVEELAGLQWKFINLREGERTISIKNAISKIEGKEHALERTRNGQYRTKNRTSIRIIPIFDFYYELLIDYKESYKYQFDLPDKELEECFVFPNVNRGNPHEYMRSDQVLLELKKALAATGLKNTDLQMFRHSCATFLILPPPDGLGYTEEKVKDYFGHQDTDMLNKVYARLNTMQKADRMRDTFSDIFKPKDTDERTEEERQKLALINRIKGDNKRESTEARKERIYRQIERAIKLKKKTYFYMAKDKEIIDEFASENGKKIDFVEA